MERKLAAILATDIAGYSAMMGEDEAGTLAALRDLRATVLDPLIAAHKGRTVKLMGDGALVEFASAVNAVECAVAIQTAKRTPAAQRIQLRIGINVGEVIVEDGDLYGDTVNIAARIEALAPSGGIALSAAVHDQVARKVSVPFASMGDRTLKNIPDPVLLYQVVLGGDAPDQPRDPGRSAHGGKPSIAVLAFDNRSRDPEQEYFSDGISEEIITELSRFQDLFVIARNSSFSYKGKAVRVQQIGHELGVQYIVEGSVRKAANRVRITVQLVEAATGNHIWAERYDRELEGIFDLQDEITQAIVAVLPFRLRAMLADRANKKPSGSLTANDCMMRARWLNNKTAGEKREEALAQLFKAIQLDPEHAPAYALLARLHSYSVYSFSPLGEDPTIAARTYAEKALGLGAGDHYVHAQVAHVYLTSGMHDVALTHAEEAVALNPNDLDALLIRGFVTSYSGDAQKGVQLLRSALAHNPLAPDDHYEMLAETYYLLRQYDEAIALYQRWRNPPVHMYTHLAACYAKRGNPEEMQKAAAIFNDLRPEDSDFAFYAAAHARLCKRQEDADHWLDGYRTAGLIT